MTQHPKRTEVDGMFQGTSKDRNNRQPASRRRLFTQIFLSVLLVSVGYTTSPNAAKADIIYTWHEDDTQQGVSGQIDVLATAQAAGQITLQDIQLFSFSAAGLNFQHHQSWNQRQLPCPHRPSHRGILRTPRDSSVLSRQRQNPPSPTS